jgi:hypothetical protein
MLELLEENDGRLLVVKVSDKLTREDYEKFIPKVDYLIGQHGKIDVLFEMWDFHGWQPGALWEDIKFTLKHFASIDRLAIVGENRWQKGMAIFCRPFTKAKVQYFDWDHREDARTWLTHEHIVAGV